MRNAHWQPVKHRRKSFAEMLIVADISVAFISALPQWNKNRIMTWRKRENLIVFFRLHKIMINYAESNSAQ